jgi:hypothetical protein
MSFCSIVLVFVVSISQVHDTLSNEKNKNPRIYTFASNKNVEKYMYH